MLLGRSVSGPGLGIRNTHLILLNGHEFRKIAVESSLAAGHRSPLSTSDELLIVSAVQVRASSRRCSRAEIPHLSARTTHSRRRVAGTRRRARSNMGRV